MSWLSRLITARGDQPSLSAQAQAWLRHWRQLPPPELDRPHFETRYVVVNTEATGLDLDADRLLAIGGLAVDGGLIHPQDAYYAPLQPVPADALAGLFGLFGNSPLVAFNAGFNRSMLERALQAHLGITPELPWIDLYYILPALFQDRFVRPARLADWMNSFGIETFQRHHALGDAWAIAQLLLAAQARALALGAATPRALADIERASRQKWSL
ncbi:3'-5' exonuclease [Thauera aromatica]|uniref:3'-5' exonuclease n=1 Tax=Thauera aromatica TaxID=59405 RepID=UPI001FFD4935|nr:3'-5' exonuclease [Thauera aromatica]MCK2087597.1 3'-5' exonuclease [Thauera aromatica]MCK2127485.1 3'-5' exonuclease [Thauera aromatica]